MMKTNQYLSDYVYLAEASYADFSEIKAQDNIDNSDSLDSLGEQLKESQENGGLEAPESFATLIANHYEVIAHYKDRTSKNESGFSGTLFKGKEGTANAGKYVLAMRGTKGLADIRADIGDIVHDGLAHRQIVDMYNFGQQIKAGKGAKYKAAKIIDVPEILSQSLLETFKDNPNDSGWIGKGYFVDSGIIKKIVFDDSDKVYNDERAWGLGISPDKLVVTGHSLGGHLAAAFSRLFPEMVDHAYMVNGAGFSAKANPIGYLFTNATINIFQVFSALDGLNDFDKNKITNIIGDKAFDVVANDWKVGLRQPGQKADLFIESFDSDSTFGHGAAQMSDSMMVASLFFAMDSSLNAQDIQVALNFLNPIFQAAHTDDKQALERILYSLGKLFLRENVSHPAKDRNEFYLQAMDLKAAIVDGADSDQESDGNDTKYRILSLVDNQAWITSAYQENADDSIAIRYALKNLNPFAVVGADYQSHNTNGELDLYSPDNPNGMTEIYIQQRSAMLQTLLKVGQTLIHYYEDKDQNIIAGQKMPFESNMEYYESPQNLFGSDGEDAFVTGGGNDYLFGGAGNDTLNGGRGNDYMEGGTDEDAYYIQGNDIVFDNDMKGKILFVNKGFLGGSTIIEASTFATKIPDMVWESKNQDHRLIASRVGNGLDLMIHYNTSSDSVIIKDFFKLAQVTANGGLSGLGISLDNVEQPAEEPIEYKLYLGDQHAPISSEGNDDRLYDWSVTHWDHKTGELKGGISQPGFADVIKGSDTKDKIKGLAGNDALDGLDGDDWLDGGDGDDLIMGGYGSDKIFGGNGNDIIASDGALRIDQRYSEKDYWDSKGRAYWVKGPQWGAIIWGAAKEEATSYAGVDSVGIKSVVVFFPQEAVSNIKDKSRYIVNPKGDDIDAGEGHNIVHASHGDDVIKSGGGNDHIIGYGGDDTIISGAGNDYIEADGKDYLGVRIEECYGNDVVFGGDGNDTILAGGGDDVVYGGAGHDTIYGDLATEGDLFHEDREEMLGNDTLNGGDGNDEIWGGKGDDIIDGEDGNDQLSGEDGNDIINGGNGNDKLFGGKGDDIINGGDGDDIISGQEGSDKLYGEAGNDNLWGFEGDDFLYGGDGDDFIAGDDGSLNEPGKLIGNDYLHGGDGSDSMYGGKGNDFLYGDNGNDFLYGGEGDDYLYGGNGDDYLGGEKGTNYLTGGAGKDFFRMNLDQAGIDIVTDFGDGDALVTYQGETGFMFIRFGMDLIAIPRRFIPEGITPVSEGLFEFVSTSPVKTIVQNFFSIPATSSALVYGHTVSEILDLLKLTSSDDSINDDRDESIDHYSYNENYSFESNYIIQKGKIQYKGNQYDLDENGGTINLAPILAENLPAWELESSKVASTTISSTLFISKLDTSLRYEFYMADFSPLPSWLSFNPETLKFTAKPDDVAAGIYDIVIRAIDKNGLSTFTHWCINVFAHNEYGEKTLPQRGTIEDDVMSGTSENDFLSGLDGNDTLYGGNGNDTLIGGSGNDTLQGGRGSDTYIFDKKFGQDVINNFDSSKDRNDIIRFNKHIKNDFYFIRSRNDDLIIRSKKGNNQIIVNNHFYNYPNLAYQINEIIFADGSKLNEQAILHTATDASEGNDLIYAYHNNETLNGLSGDDELHGNHTDNILIGGLGNDMLEGGGGSDTYIFGKDFGFDRINNYDISRERKDIIQFTFHTQKDFRFKRSGVDLIIDDKSGFNSLTIGNYFTLDSRSDYQVDEIVFSDGGKLSIEEIKSLVQKGTAYSDELYAYSSGSKLYGLKGYDRLYGAEGNDFLDGGRGMDELQGGDGDDVLVGGEGNDTLDGGTGTDTYIFAKGWGKDSIIENVSAGETNTIIFQDAVLDNLIFELDMSGSLYISTKDGNDRVQIWNYFSDNPYHDNYQIFLADNTLLDRQQVENFLHKASQWDDKLYASVSGSRLDGLEGDDRLYGNSGNDILIGGSGNDIFQDSAGGDDTYIFSRGFGQDEIYDYNYRTDENQKDIIQFTDHISDDFRFIRLEDDLIIRAKEGCDRVKIEKFFFKDEWGNHQIEEIFFADGTKWKIKEIMDRVEADSTVYSNDVYDYIADTVDKSKMIGTLGDETLYASEQGSVLNGWIGDDRLYGEMGDDILLGGEGDDELLGYGGDDVLIGGTGKDYLSGGTGSNTYIFSKGFGQDTITDLGSNPKIIFTDSAKDEASFSNLGDALIIHFHITQDCVLISGYFSENMPDAKIIFADGIELDTNDAKALLKKASDEDDSLSFDNIGNTLDGLAGDDQLLGGSGNDILIGGTGYDRLLGGEGSDTYIFSKGFQQDDIIDFGIRHEANQQDGSATLEEKDIILFTDYRQDDFWFIRIQDNLVIKAKEGNDRITIEDYFLEDWQYDRDIEEIVFADGVRLDSEAIHILAERDTSLNTSYDYQQDTQQLTKVFGSAFNDDVFAGKQGNILLGLDGNDSIIGNVGNDILIGGNGNDYLCGEGGADTYIFARGHGNDVILENHRYSEKGIDTLMMQGVRLADTQLSRIEDDLLLTGYSDGDSVLIEQFFDSDGDYQVENLVFDDHTLSSTDIIRLSQGVNGLIDVMAAFSIGSSGEESTASSYTPFLPALTISAFE